MPELYQFEDFELEPGAYRLSCKGDIVHLERIPLELLSLLVQRRDDVVTRAQILESVWGEGVFIDSENAINTAVRKLRRALKDDADTPRFIVTIPAKGYRFMAPVMVSNGQSQIEQDGQPPNNSAPDVHLASSALEHPAAPSTHWRGGLLTAIAFAAIAAAVIAGTYVWRRASLSTAKIATQAPEPTIPNIPSIAVLPFTNLSGDPQQEYFSDGITEELITDLSRLPNLTVIARSSSFAYKGKNEPVQKVAGELGVNYLLEGSVRKSGSHVRINVQLVDAAGAHQLWAHRYDKELIEVLALQDEIVQSVIVTLGLQFTVLRKGMVIPQHTNNLEAHDYYLRGCELLFITDSYPQARAMFEKAVAADPGYSDAYTWLALAHQIEYFWQFAGDADTPEKSEKLARKAISLDESNADAYAILAVALAFENRPAEAIAMARRALALDDNDANALITLSGIYNMLKQPEEALEFAQKTLRLLPNHPENILFEVGFAYNQMARYREALQAFKQSNPDNAWVHVGLVYSYTELGYEHEAQMQAGEVLRIAPNFSLELARRRWPGFFDDIAGRHYLDDLRQAGLK